MITTKCAAGLHGHCHADGASCSCETCHLGPCTTCGADNLQRIYGGLCATCVREQAAVDRAQRRTSSCDRCGVSNAYRNPATRRNEILCTSCHLAAGESMPMVPKAAGLATTCGGTPKDDLRHVWVRVCGHRFVCSNCRTHRFDRMKEVQQ